MHHTMDKSRKFREVFREIDIDEKLCEAFREACVSQLQYKKATGQVEIRLEIPSLVQMNRVYSLEKTLTRYFNTAVQVVPCFRVDKDDKELLEGCTDDLCQVLSQKSKHYECLLENAEFQVVGQKLNIHLCTNGKLILQAGNCHKVLEDFIEPALAEM